MQLSPNLPPGPILCLTSLVRNRRTRHKTGVETQVHGIETPPPVDIVNLLPLVTGANGKTTRRGPGERTMTVFTQHPHAQGVSYAEHLDFAIGIAWHLFMCVLSFTKHALFTFISI